MSENFKELTYDPKYTLMVISSDKLIVPRELYQREEMAKRINAIVSGWDERIANEPKVSDRNGVYYVFDGQHTILAREAMNGGEPIEILCKVYRELTVAEEAILFAKQTGISSKPTAGEKLRAVVFAGDADAEAFCKATESVGLLIDITGTRYDGHIACLSTAKRIYNRMGQDKYIEALHIIKDAWDGKSESLRNEIIKAVAEFVWIYHGKYDRNILIQRLKAVEPITIRNNIKIDLVRPDNKKYVYQIWKVYNGSRKKNILEMLF